MTDKEIVQNILGGETRAYSELVDRYTCKAMGLAIRLMKNREDAEEAAQDAFLKAFQALGTFQWKSGFATWLYRIVYNTCLTKLQSRKREGYASADEFVDDAEAMPPDLFAPDHVMEAEELGRIVQEEIERLPADYAVILTLFILNEQSYEEIVLVTGLPLGTVKNRLFRARELLRTAIRKQYRPSVRSEILIGEKS